MGFPTPADARRWLELRDTDPAAFAALHPMAQEIAQDYDDRQAARDRRPTQPWARRDERSDQLLALRDSDRQEDRDRFSALPGHVIDELVTYEDVVGKVAK